MVRRHRFGVIIFDESLQAHFRWLEVYTRKISYEAVPPALVHTPRLQHDT
jgi:hypothetical protein